jgi:Domain of unknown function (DUF4337)
MDNATETLDHMQHAAHAGEHNQHNRFSTYTGITMAVLGVLLAFASAKVGGERTELIKSMVEQQDAHMRYVTQDIKHRVAVISLRQLRATVPALPASAKPARASARSVPRLDAKETLALANTIGRYYRESQAARVWADAYNPVVRAHVEGQENYELGLLASEIGIVIASVALLLRRRVAWYLAIALGIASVGMVAFTYAQTSPVVHDTEKKIEEYARAYHDLRAQDKTTQDDDALVNEMIATYGKQ